MKQVDFDCDIRNYERLKKLAEETGKEPMQILAERVHEVLERMDADTREKWRDMGRKLLKRLEERDRKEGGFLNV